jgi:hypothetical protein
MVSHVQERHKCIQVLTKPAAVEDNNIPLMHMSFSGKPTHTQEVKEGRPITLLHDHRRSVVPLHEQGAHDYAATSLHSLIITMLSVWQYPRRVAAQGV